MSDQKRTNNWIFGIPKKVYIETGHWLVSNHRIKKTNWFYVNLMGPAQPNATICHHQFRFNSRPSFQGFFLGTMWNDSHDWSKLPTRHPSIVESPHKLDDQGIHISAGILPNFGVCLLLKKWDLKPHFCFPKLVVIIFVSFMKFWNVRIDTFF